MALAIITFVAALALIASERVDRTKVALAAMVVVLLTQTIGQEEAIAAIDWNTLGLLAGMMIMVKVTEPTGVYAWLAIRAGHLSRGRPFAVLLALAGTTALLSAFLDNLTTILLVVPITFLLADALDIDPIPLIVTEVLVSNIGGTATLIGDPPNILIAGAADLTFMAFIVNLAPIVAVTFAVVVAGSTSCSGGSCTSARRRARGSWTSIPPARSRTWTSSSARPCPRRDDPRLLRPPGASHRAGTVAMAGATAMLFASRAPLERSLASIEWPTLFFFIGLFVLVGALEDAAPSTRSPTASHRSPTATAPPSCSASPGPPRSARRSWTTSPSPPR